MDETDKILLIFETCFTCLAATLIQTNYLTYYQAIKLISKQLTNSNGKGPFKVSQQYDLHLF